MAKLLILGKNFSGGSTPQNNYRGAMRKKFPNWKLPKYSAIQRTILSEALAELRMATSPGYTGDETAYQVCKKLTYLFTQYSESGEKYEMIELTYPFEHPAHKSHLLGYDVISGSDSSLIATIFSNPDKDPLGQWEKAIKRKYIHKLNKHLLFDCLQEAFLFYEEAQKVQPSDRSLEILGVHECLAP